MMAKSQTKPDKNTPVLECKDVSISYYTRAGEIPAVVDFNLTVMPGEAVGIVGESGCGKSTVALAIMQYMGKNGDIVVDVVWSGVHSDRTPVMLCLQGTNSGAHLSWGETRMPAGCSSSVSIWWRCASTISSCKGQNRSFSSTISRPPNWSRNALPR